MQLTKKSIQKLIEIVQNDYGRSLTDEEAEQFGDSILHLTKIAKVIHEREIQY